MNQTRSEVEISYMKRIDGGGYYFEVKVRSVSQPHLLKLAIVERGADERRNLGITAGAMAEEWGEQLNEDRDPGSAARAAMGAYDRLNELNPIPRWGDETPLA